MGLPTWAKCKLEENWPASLTEAIMKVEGFSDVGRGESPDSKRIASSLIICLMILERILQQCSYTSSISLPILAFNVSFIFLSQNSCFQLDCLGSLFAHNIMKSP